jgi:spore coat protein CotH
MSFQAWNRLQATAPSGHVEIAHESAVLFIDGRYEGLYALTDQVNRDLFEDGALALDDGGNLYKSVNHDANFRLTRAFSTESKAFLGEGWETRDEPDLIVNQWTDLEDLVLFADTSSDADFHAQLGARIDVGDLVDWWVFATLILGEDSYGKNAYLYKATPQEPFRFAPWDFNHSYGQAWETSRTDAATPIDEGWPLESNRLWERMLTSPTYRPLMEARYAQALEGPLALDAVLADWDAFVDEVRDSGLRDERKWGAEYRAFYADRGREDLLTFLGEEVYARQWIIDRWTSVRSQLSK